MSNKVDEFYNIFKFCVPTNKELADNERQILENIINMSNKEATSYIRQYVVKLTHYNKNFLDYKTAKEILKIIIEIGFIIRIQYLDYLKKKENNTLNNDDEEITNLSRMIQLLVSEISIIMSTKEYEFTNMFDNMEELKSDSTIGHINRVFITSIEAIAFFNEKLKQGIINKIRVDFNKVYYKHAERIYKLYNIEDKKNTLESNVKLGIRKIETNTVIDTVVGILMHDITLNKPRDYMPISTEEKDNHSIKDYSFAKYFMRRSEGIALTVSLHHEYYGYGYGLFTELYKAALQRNPNHQIEYIISYDYKDILTLQSLTYLPAKILEVVDLYDTLTNSIKKTCSEAINFLVKECIENYILLDPIITDMFIKYLKENKKIKL